MARMHSRDKGKSGSTRPSTTTKPNWIRYKESEIEMITAKLAKEGKTKSEIGLILRDSYGIPSMKLITGKKIGKILKEKKIKEELPEDLKSLLKKAMEVRKHLETNRQDMTAKRGLQLTDSKILRLVRYYKTQGKLPQDWKYDPKNISMYM